ncbi:uncharacterized protein G2W53_024074 [Senna tora]|uniref:Uncharacterized protein n=1 Tax=Senna tora TaxID=362788 RepID=A0A834TBL2_9FABA|nr:uncharacterized protein G2W53_024074 [Senna tora]
MGKVRRATWGDPTVEVSGKARRSMLIAL